MIGKFQGVSVVTVNKGFRRHKKKCCLSTSLWFDWWRERNTALALLGSQYPHYSTARPDTQVHIVEQIVEDTSKRPPWRTQSDP
jgi:hypothetical protein